MQTFENKLQREARKRGYVCLTLSTPNTWVIVPAESNRCSSASMGDAITEALKSLGATPLAPPTKTGGFWIHIKVEYHGEPMYVSLVAEPKEILPATVPSLLATVLYIHGWIVAPSWWNFLVLPAWYSSLSALWKLIAG